MYALHLDLQHIKNWNFVTCWDYKYRSQVLNQREEVFNLQFGRVLIKCTVCVVFGRVYRSLALGFQTSGSAPSTTTPALINISHQCVLIYPLLSFVKRPARFRIFCGWFWCQGPELSVAVLSCLVSDCRHVQILLSEPRLSLGCSRLCPLPCSIGRLLPLLYLTTTCLFLNRPLLPSYHEFLSRRL